MAGLMLLLQIAITPMTMDSTRVVNDSVEYNVKWSYDTGSTAMVRIDTLRFWRQTTPGVIYTKKLATNTRTTTARYSKQSGNVWGWRVACLKYWSKGVATMRCLTQNTAKLVRIELKPDSVSLEAGP